MNISRKALAKITKSYFNKTLTELISERVIIEAQHELYLTSKTIKEMAYELGYEDEPYFSRKPTPTSPHKFTVRPLEWPGVSIKARRPALLIGTSRKSPAPSTASSSQHIIKGHL